MENKLEILTRKLYEEGVGKAEKEAKEIIGQAKREAAEIVAEARSTSEKMLLAGKQEADSLKQRAGSEMALSARQAIAALKQQITGLVSGKVAAEMAQAGVEDKAFVQRLLLAAVQKWDIASGDANLELVVPEQEKKEWIAFVADKYKKLLDKGLEIKAGSPKETFVIQPQDGGYKITFSEELFQAFFTPYLKALTKELLYP